MAKKKFSLRPWLIMLGVLAALAAVTYYADPSRGKDRPTEDVAISDLVGYVKDHKVAEVVIRGTEAAGISADRKVVFRSYTADAEILRAAAYDSKIRVTEKAPPSDDSFLMNFLMYALLVGGSILLIGYLFKRSSGGAGGMAKFGKSKAKRAESATVRFSDLAGIDEAVEQAQTLVDFLREPGSFTRLGARAPKGILLQGPPGTGKTLLARAIAGEAGVPFLSCSASEFVEMFVGVGAARIRDLFEEARRVAPCIIFIDEVEALCARRGVGHGGGGDTEREQTLNQLLKEMDGFEGGTGIIVLGATNRPEAMDKAIMRPGRFDQHVTVPKPDRQGRLAILQIYARNIKFAADIDLEKVAHSMTGATGADLESLLNEAATRAATLGLDEVDQSCLDWARDKITMGGPEMRSMVLTEATKRIIACHEAGHALVGWLTSGSDPVRKVTIVPRGQALGLTVSSPTEDIRLQSRSYLLAFMSKGLGGRVAEEVATGDITNGASNDLERVTTVAKAMVMQWAMVDALGPRVFGERQHGAFLDYGSETRDYSEATAQKIDAAVDGLVRNAYHHAKQLIESNRDKLDRLAEALLERETVDEADLLAIFGPRPAA
jgi:cell division protease FtsH